ncbi:hypothetical protein MM188_003183 [Vibrio cholerae]|nr:hypothetical protein [Vibrio cholerae]
MVIELVKRRVSDARRELGFLLFRVLFSIEMHRQSKGHCNLRSSFSYSGCLFLDYNESLADGLGSVNVGDFVKEQLEYLGLTI